MTSQRRRYLVHNETILVVLCVTGFSGLDAVGTHQSRTVRNI